MIKKVLMVLAIVVLGATAASAQLRFGVKLGVDVNSLHFSSQVKDDLLSSDNRAGFIGGLMTEYTVPEVGLGFDASLMYVHRSNKLSDLFNSDGTLAGTSYNEDNYDRDYIELPINLKYKLNIPAIGSVFTPYLFTGPSFAFLISKKDFKEIIKSKICDVAWNFGLGAELVSHLQVSASYAIGLTKATNYVDNTGQEIEGKNKYWTVTAAYLF